MNLKRLAEISPIIGSYLIFVGFFKLDYYYGHWNINIINYLDFSEIILSFLNDLNVMIFFIVLMLLQSILGILTVVTIDHNLSKRLNPSVTITPETTFFEVKKQKEQKPYKNIKDRLDETFESKPALLSSTFLILTIVSGLLFAFYCKLIFLYLTFIFGVQLLSYFLLTVLKAKDEKAVLQACFIVVLFFFSLGIGKYEIIETEKNVKTVEILKENDETITTDKNLIFLGKTNNFYFFYDNLKKRSIIFPSTTIKRVSQGG